MTPLRPAVMACLLPLALHAQTDADAAALSRVIDHGCVALVDANPDCERVTLIRSDTEPDTADLVIHAGPRERTNAALLIVPNAVFAGIAWGTLPTLEETETGLLITAQQSAIGRHPWFETIDITHDGTAFVVTGYAFSTYDRALPRTFSCTADFIAGRFAAELEIGDAEDPDAPPRLDRRQGAIGTAAPTLANWRAFGPRPGDCNTIPAAMYAFD